VARSREIPEKCRRCAPLIPADARAKHPQCWDDKLCTARRFYINNRDRRGGAQASDRSETIAQTDRNQASNFRAPGELWNFTGVAGNARGFADSCDRN
jgi:3,4-dihydroxy-2-butanone 4-phosphate synthase